MPKAIQQEINEDLGLDFKHDNGVWIKSGMALRRLLGILGMGLPVALLIATFLFFRLATPLESISHYYFTRAGGVFSAVMVLIGIFLIIYNGKEPLDFYISTVAGIAALVVAFLPTGNLVANCCDNPEQLAITFLEANNVREAAHLIAAGIFIALLSVMSFFIFTKSNQPPALRTPAKRNRNRVFRTCSILMIVALLVIGAGFMGLINPAWYTQHRITFWMETLAVEAFGFSWLVKGEVLMTD